MNTSANQKTIDQNVANWQKENEARKRKLEWIMFHTQFNVVIKRGVHIPDHVLVNGKKHHDQETKVLPAPAMHKQRAAVNHQRMEANHPGR